ncbi:pseudouridine synthase [Hesseltinella vesiculosa]|uniref:Pseudouridine synthase n=1 Tax=Hesseltinella vesiculosa TaxID=101127 RepID=A0A1X2GVR5_9FUNG|nr:pseudouridine synthase [Hesseltinella vesiculosa]
MIVEDPLIVEKINALLPDQIRVWGYALAQKSFHARKECDSRRYEYLLPTSTLMPELDWCKDDNKGSYRLPASTLQKFRDALQLFVGTHSFHNYTIRRNQHTHMSLKRYIKDITVSDPFLPMPLGDQWLSVKLYGQSFMLHQIRKMIAMAMLTIRTQTPLPVIAESLSHKALINIPKAPASGLLLDHPVFRWYNEKIDTQLRQPIDFDLYKDQMQTFKKTWIDQQIFETEAKEKDFSRSPVSFSFSSACSFAQMAQQEKINELVHAVAGVAHIQKPLYQQRLAIDKVKIEKAPVDTALSEANIKCSLESEKKRCQQGLVKAKDLLNGAQNQASSMEAKLQELEHANEKYEVDYRSLCKFREELAQLLDQALDGQKVESQALVKVDQTKEKLKEIEQDKEGLKQVRELVKVADDALLEAILDLRTSNKEGSLGAGQVYFPQEAFDALKKAREVYPRLPAIQRPVEFKDEADDTGAFYSPMQRYLWDVRRQLAKLLDWCDIQVLEIMDMDAQLHITLGEALDQYNVERRQLALTL